MPRSSLFHQRLRPGRQTNMGRRAKERGPIQANIARYTRNQATSDTNPPPLEPSNGRLGGRTQHDGDQEQEHNHVEPETARENPAAMARTMRVAVRPAGGIHSAKRSGLTLRQPQSHSHPIH